MAAAGGARGSFGRRGPRRESEADGGEPAGRPVGLAFRCINAKEVDGVYARVIAAGFRGKAPPYDAFWGQRYATVLDPDGNGVDLFADLPK